MQDQNDTIGWKKGIYPTNNFLRINKAAERLYTGVGFKFVQAKICFMKIPAGRNTNCLSLIFSLGYVDFNTYNKSSRMI